MKTLYLCGAGNSEGVRLARRVTDRDGGFDRIVILDDDPEKHGRELLGAPIVGPIAALADAAPGCRAVNLVARTTAGRAAVHDRIVATGVPLMTLVHPGVDPTDCELGAGALVYEQAILSPLTAVGEDSVVFMRALVGHDSIVGRGCVVAAGAVLNARVVLEDRVYVGTNASVLPDVRVGAGATIGANTMAAADVPPGATVVGVPGQVVVPPQAAAAAAAPASAPPSARSQLLEARMMPVLHALLGADRARPTDHFFDVGGTSLLAIQLIERLRAELGQEVGLQDLYAHGSIRELARHLAGDALQGARLGQQRGAVRRRIASRLKG